MQLFRLENTFYSWRLFVIQNRRFNASPIPIPQELTSVKALEIYRKNRAGKIKIKYLNVDQQQALNTF